MAKLENKCEYTPALAQEAQQHYVAFSMSGQYDLPLLGVVVLGCTGIAVWLRDPAYIAFVVGGLVFLGIGWFFKRRSVVRELEKLRAQNAALPVRQHVEINEGRIRVKRSGPDSLIPEFTALLEDIVGYYETANTQTLVTRDRQLIVLPKNGFTEGSSDVLALVARKLPIRRRSF